MADHVELGIAQIREAASLLRELLHPVFAEQALPGFVGFRDGFGGEGLGHRHQRDFFRMPARAPGSDGDALMYVRKVGSDGHWEMICTV